MRLNVNVVHGVNERRRCVTRQPEGDQVINSRPHEHVRPPVLRRQPPDLNTLEVDAAKATTRVQFVNQVTSEPEMRATHRGVEVTENLTRRTLSEPEFWRLASPRKLHPGQLTDDRSCCLSFPGMDQK